MIRERVKAMTVPTGLVRRVTEAVNAHRDQAWDAVIADLVIDHLVDNDTEQDAEARP